MQESAELMGKVLARAHASSGDAASIAGYVGLEDTFDKAIATFSTQYADKTERDYEALKAAVSSGRVKVTADVSS